VTNSAAVILTVAHIMRAWPLSQRDADVLWPIWEQQLALLFVHDALRQLAGQQDFIEAIHADA